jgi:uncharacterized protein YxjI
MRKVGLSGCDSIASVSEKEFSSAGRREERLRDHATFSLIRGSSSMRYRMRQKLFSFGDDFTIQDDAGRDVFFVDGKAFSIGNKLSFQDMAGRELAFIRQKLLSWGPTYVIEMAGGGEAVVKKQLFTFFQCAFTVDLPGTSDDLEAKGNLTDHEYTFERGGRPVATVSKQWFALADTYGVDIADGQDDVLILASTVVIDMCCHGDSKNNRS